MSDFKSYWYVCHSCDASIEVVSKGIHFQDPTCNCNNSQVVWCQTNVLESDPNQTKEEKMTTMYDSSSQTSMAENYQNNATMIVKNQTSGEIIYQSMTPYDVNVLLNDYHYAQQRLSRYISMIDRITDNLTEDAWFNPNVDKDDALWELCEIIDHSPVKTINFSGTMSFEGSVDVPLNELGDFDLQYFLQDEIYMTSNSGNLEIDSYEIDSVNEGY